MVWKEGQLRCRPHTHLDMVLSYLSLSPFKTPPTPQDEVLLAHLGDEMVSHAARTKACLMVHLGRIPVDLSPRDILSMHKCRTPADIAYG